MDKGSFNGQLVRVSIRANDIRGKLFEQRHRAGSTRQRLRNEFTSRSHGRVVPGIQEMVSK
jgi:hypothetical protein